MTDKNTLKQKLEETKAKLKTNSKDAHFADSLISDLESLCGQLKHEPTVMHYELKDVEGSVSGDTFELSIMKDGTAIYHVYGGYTIIADTRSRSLNMTLKMLYECLKNGEEFGDETLPDAVCHVLSLPMVVFSDAELTYKIATVMLEWVNNVYENSISSDLKDEDPNAMRELQEDMNFRKTIKDALS